MIYLHRDLAVVLEADKRPVQAEAEFRKSLEVAEQAAAALPENVKAWETIGHCTRYLGGYMRRLMRPADAEQAYDQGVRAFETARMLPGASDAGERYFASDTRRYVADAILAQNRPAEAEALYRQAVEGFRTLPAEKLQNADARRQVNNCMNAFIGFLRSQGRPQEAAGVIQQAIEFYSRLSTELPQEGAFLQEISRLRAEAAELTKEKSDSKTPEPAKKAEAKPAPNP